MNFTSIFQTIFTFLLLIILLVWGQSIFNPLFLIEELQYHFEVYDLRGLVKGTLFFCTYLSSVFIFYLFIRIQSEKIFKIFLLSVFIFTSIDLFTQLLGISHGFSLAEFRLGQNEMGNYKFLISYLDTIGKALLIAFLFILLIYFIRLQSDENKWKNSKVFYILIPLFLIYGACYKIDTFKLSTYPATIKIPLIGLDAVRTAQPLIKRHLSKEIQVKNTPKFKNIIWVIDESVTGTYLSLNGYEKKTTPYLDALAKSSPSMVNFGIVNSISNCSSLSNLLMRIGLNPKSKRDINQDVYTMPTIFQYAKRAGYTTWLLDSQTRKDHLQNYLTLYDKEDIDYFETLGPDVERDERDSVFSDKVTALINKRGGEKNFIVLVKYGSHFPYLLTYKPENTRFKPVVNVSYGGMDQAHKEEQMNTYLNSIYSSTDLYLKNFISSLDLSETILFYTSDHGQNILETEGLTRTHCNSEVVVKNEVSVPLMVFQKEAKSLFPEVENKLYSQIQLFPTTLKFLGYDKEIISSYGKTLFEGYPLTKEREYILSSSLEVKVYK